MILAFMDIIKAAGFGIDIHSRNMCRNKYIKRILLISYGHKMFAGGEKVCKASRNDIKVIHLDTAGAKYLCIIYVGVLRKEQIT